jgi:hypothetical protein
VIFKLKWSGGSSLVLFLLFVQVFIVENVIVVRKHNYFACKIRRENDG